MGYRNLAECVADLEKSGQLRRIDTPLSPNLEIGALQRLAFQKKGPALLFTRPVGCRFPLLANLFGTRERLRFIFRDSLSRLQILLEIAADPPFALRKPRNFPRIFPFLLNALPARKRHAPVLACQCGLAELPKLKSWPLDGGSFITLPLVHSADPASGRTNLGMYRIQLTGNSYAADETGLHYQLKRGIGAHHAAALAKGERLPVHICVGGPPNLTVAAVMPLPEGMSEFAFAGLLGARKTALYKNENFSLPVLAEADFIIQSEILPELRPEGPFGDHLGYYSLTHDFPALKVKGVWHRKDAIWPFTTVGRPPQEDTVFGDFIHELTAPLAGKVFEGIKEIQAVDAAGVHPLLLAIGQERFTPWEARPRELLTEALHLLGTSQTALAKYLLIAMEAPGLSTRDVKGFLLHMLRHSDFSCCLHFITNTSTDTLDYSGSALNEGSRLIWTAGETSLRELGPELRAIPAMPPGFGNLRLAAPGIILVEGPANDLPRGETDPSIAGPLCAALAQWKLRDNFPLWIVVDDSAFCAKNFNNFLWATFTRSDPETDIYGANAQIRKKSWLCSPPLVIDARKKPFHAPELEEDPQVLRRLENLAAKHGPLEGLL